VLFGVVGEVVCLGEADVGSDGDVGLSAQRVPDPADAQLPNAVDAVDAGDRIRCLVAWSKGKGGASAWCIGCAVPTSATC
jgi:hypothetical protein